MHVYLIIWSNPVIYLDHAVQPKYMEYDSGCWCTYPSENDGVRQLGWWNSQYDGKVIQNSMVPVTTNQLCSPIINHYQPYQPLLTMINQD